MPSLIGVLVCFALIVSIESIRRLTIFVGRHSASARCAALAVRINKGSTDTVFMSPLVKREPCFSLHRNRLQSRSRHGYAGKRVLCARSREAIFRCRARSIQFGCQRNGSRHLCLTRSCVLMKSSLPGGEIIWGCRYIQVWSDRIHLSYLGLRYRMDSHRGAISDSSRHSPYHPENVTLAY